MRKEHFNNNLLNIYYQLYDFCEHDSSTPHVDCVLHNILENWRAMITKCALTNIL